ncbi:NRDE family protein [Azomonas macrocytogenes]|uniref:Uncharacterized protein with NRDE domain n=1 Tax=Azomonas macrocytogenes TaxID=69962 RepID=A0A839T377_AZOMA|nr:uncharacterized protein with NRDE domain [Azomonas macrocytogenes]
MCLIVFAWRPDHPLPLIVAANRDEYHDRPTLPLAPWDDCPAIVAGRDLKTRGTWMGIGPGGRFAALTNIRDPRHPVGHASRGALPEGFLRGSQSPLEYLQQIVPQRHCYSGFNLLVGDAHQLCHLNSQEGLVRVVPPGLHGLSNATLNTPWPKLHKARTTLAGHLAKWQPDDRPGIDALLNILADTERAPDEELPMTGIALERERMLSSIFVLGTDYGTRSSTILLRHAGGACEIVERGFDRQGTEQSEVRLHYAAPGDTA